MRRWFMPVAATILAVALGAAIPATAATHGAAHRAKAANPGLSSSVRILTTPTVHYLMSDNEEGTDFYHTITTSTTSNPSNYEVRAGIFCGDEGWRFGKWANGKGGSSESCTSGVYGSEGEFEFDETHKYQLVCYIVGDPVDGQCTGG